MNISRLLKRGNDFRAAGVMCDSKSIKAKKKYVHPSATRRKCFLTWSLAHR
jgi:hypothetical protein